MAAWQKAFPTSEISAGKAKSVTLGGVRIALCQVGADFYAIQDVCTHDNGPLGQGELEGDRIECPRHGAWFNVKTGKVLSLPAVRDIKTFPVKVEGGELYVEV